MKASRLACALEDDARNNADVPKKRAVHTVPPKSAIIRHTIHSKCAIHIYVLTPPYCVLHNKNQRMILVKLDRQMKSGPFITLVSEAFNIPEKSVFVIARTLREAGYLTSGARGVNAPHMTLTDAARLSIALLTGEPASRLIDVFLVFREQTLREAPSASNPFFEVLKLTLSATLEETIVALFEMLASPDPGLYARYGNAIRPEIEFNDRVRHARILFGGEELVFHNEALEREIEVSNAVMSEPMPSFEGRVFPGSKEYAEIKRHTDASIAWGDLIKKAHGFSSGMITTRAMDVQVLSQIANGMTHDDS